MNYEVIFGCVPMNKQMAEHFEAEALERASHEANVWITLYLQLFLSLSLSFYILLYDNIRRGDSLIVVAFSDQKQLMAVNFVLMLLK
jgi:hypothetical protein